MKMKEKNKIIAVTMGDPAGVGPEIILKAAKKINLSAVVVGNSKVLKFYDGKIKTGARIYSVKEDEIKSLKPAKGVLPVFEVKDSCSDEITVGVVRKRYGEMVFRYIKKAVGLCLDGTASAMVTAPINKESLNLAGHHYPGHTELLKELTSSPDVVMMLQGGKLRVALATTHLALKDVSKKIKKADLLRTITIISESLKKYEGKKPVIGVCSLNPHAGDGGIFGGEEKSEILPAIEEAVKKGIKALGPLSADTIFTKAVRGEFDAVVAMYHDQGMGPLKLHCFGSGVNVSLGLPIIRTSVDHGTAFDIAGRGNADPASLIEAIRLALRWSSAS